MCDILPTVPICDKSGSLDPTSHLEEGKLAIHCDKKLGLAGQTNL